MIGEDVILRLTIAPGDVYALSRLLLPTILARTPLQVLLKDYVTAAHGTGYITEVTFKGGTSGKRRR